MKTLSSALLTSTLLAALSLPHAAAVAATGRPATKKSVKKSHTKKAVPAQFELAVPDDTDTGAAIDPKSSLTTEYHCELGANVTIYRNDGDDQYIALQWQKMITRMARVSTTTGANRFANKRSGLVWIGIPAKGILLDAKNGHQLANECKDAQQAAPKAVLTPVTPAPSSAPAPASSSSSSSSASAPAPASGSASAPTDNVSTSAASSAAASATSTAPVSQAVQAAPAIPDPAVTTALPKNASTPPTGSDPAMSMPMPMPTQTSSTSKASGAQPTEAPIK